jgi:hypothetical protein
MTLDVKNLVMWTLTSAKTDAKTAVIIATLSIMTLDIMKFNHAGIKYFLYKCRDSHYNVTQY